MNGIKRRYPFVIEYNIYNEMVITCYTTYKTHIVSPEELYAAVVLGDEAFDGHDSYTVTIQGLEDLQ